jgi:hypothetical protein
MDASHVISQSVDGTEGPLANLTDFSLRRFPGTFNNLKKLLYSLLIILHPWMTNIQKIFLIFIIQRKIQALKGEESRWQN